MIRNGNWYNGKEIYKILNLAITSFELEQQNSAIDPKNITRRGQKGGGLILFRTRRMNVVGFSDHPDLTTFFLIFLWLKDVFTL